MSDRPAALRILAALRETPVRGTGVLVGSSGLFALVLDDTKTRVEPVMGRELGNDAGQEPRGSCPGPDERAVPVRDGGDEPERGEPVDRSVFEKVGLQVCAGS